MTPMCVVFYLSIRGAGSFYDYEPTKPMDCSAAEEIALSVRGETQAEVIEVPSDWNRDEWWATFKGQNAR